MLGIITCCMVLITVFETIKFVAAMIEHKQSKEMFDEFMKAQNTYVNDDNELPFK